MKIMNALVSFGIVSTTLLSAQAFATESRVIANCNGDHHGSYLTVREIIGSEGLAQLLVIRQDDAENLNIYEAVEMKKDGAVLPLKAYSWAFRQVVKAMDSETWYGNVRVKLVDARTGSKMLLDLQRYVSTIESALLIDENIEPLKCYLPQ
jgi:hypothetical protein